MSEALEWLGRRVENDPSFLASVLAEYARCEKLDDAGLADALGCPPENLAAVRLCRTPRTDPVGLRQDTADMARAFGLDPFRLARVVRRVGALVELRRASGGVLMAARDRTPEAEGRA